MSETMKAAVPAGVTRRNILAAPLLAAMAGAYAEGARAAVPTETPVMALFREWQAAKADEDALGARAHALTSDEAETLADAAEARRYAIEQELIKAKAQNAKDVLAKIAAWADFGVFQFDGSDERLAQTWAEARALVAA